MSMNPLNSNAPLWLRKSKHHEHIHTLPEKLMGYTQSEWVNAIIQSKPSFLCVTGHWYSEYTAQEQSMITALQNAGIKLIGYLNTLGWARGGAKDNPEGLYNRIDHFVRTYGFKGVWFDGWIVQRDREHYSQKDENGDGVIDNNVYVNPYLNEADVTRIRNIIKSVSSDNILLVSNDAYYLAKWFNSSMLNETREFRGNIYGPYGSWMYELLDCCDWEHYMEDYFHMYGTPPQQFDNYDLLWNTILELEKKPLHPRWICGNATREQGGNHPTIPEMFPNWISLVNGWNKDFVEKQGFSTWFSNGGGDDYCTNPKWLTDHYPIPNVDYDGNGPEPKPKFGKYIPAFIIGAGILQEVSK